MNILVLSSALAVAILSNSVWADPNDSVLSTYAENGLRQVEFRLGSIGQSGQASQDGATLGFGYGLTERWFSELYLSYVKSGSEAIGFDSGALQNTFVLSSGQYPVDVGLYTEIEYEQDRSTGYKFTFGPLMQTEFGLTKVNFNLLFHRNFLADSPFPMQLDYQWQVKHHWNAPVDIGIQGFGELGEWNHWAPQSQQSHRLGPAIFGKKSLGENQVLNYNAAILFDVFDQTHATTVRMQIVYGF